MIKKQPIGVFDSGVGGLTALTHLAALLPDEDLLYLGDTARVPYGNRSPETIKLYARQLTEFLLERSVKVIVVACNTISSIAMVEIEKISPVPVIGVIKPAVATALQVSSQGIGIIGTRATIQSRAYENEIDQMRDGKNILVMSEACPLFVPLVEEGWHDHLAAYTVAREYLSPLKSANIDVLILGCTHYPLLKKVLGEIMPGVKLIDSGEEAATLTAKLIQIDQLVLRRTELLAPRSIECYVTDMTPTVLRIAQQFLGLPADSVHEITI